jgi:hypothetical protein
LPPPPSAPWQVAQLSAKTDSPAAASPAARADGASYAIEPILDLDGGLTGQRVVLGTAARAAASLELPAESFAAGPFGRLVVVGSDDGRTSELRAFDATTGCSWSVVAATDVIRPRSSMSPLVTYTSSASTAKPARTWAFGASRSAEGWRSR